jgi:hypothetical protein
MHAWEVDFRRSRAKWDHVFNFGDLAQDWLDKEAVNTF